MIGTNTLRKSAAELCAEHQYGDAFCEALDYLRGDRFDFKHHSVALLIIAANKSLGEATRMLDDWVHACGFGNLENAIAILGGALDDDGERYSICGRLASICILHGHHDLAIKSWGHCLTSDLTSEAEVATTCAEYVKVASVYDAERQHTVAVEMFMDFVASHITTDGMTVLDAPCGTGLMGRHFNSSNRLIGLDLSSDMLDVARASSQYDTLAQGDMLALLHRYRAELVLTHNAMYYFQNLEEVVIAVSKSLISGGWFAFTDMPAPNGVMSTVGGNARYGRSAAMTRAVLEKHGYKEVAMRLGISVGLPSYYWMFQKM